MDHLTIARYISVPTAFVLTGYAMSASQSTVPLLYKNPTPHAAELFKGVYQNGAKFAAPCAIVSASAFIYLALAIPAQRRLYGGAAALILSTPVWTNAVMLPGINRIIEIAGNSLEQQKTDATGEEAVKLMKTWVWQNWVRAALFASSGLVALYAWAGGI